MNDEMRREELEERLRLLTAEFEQQMRARGFDPAQVENIALPSSLARLSEDCQTIREELEEMQKG